MSFGSMRIEPPWLAADVGGTNARFGLAAGPAGPVTAVAHLRCAGFASPVGALRHYFATITASPRAAAFALAAPVEADDVQLTNGPWRFERRALCAAFGFERPVLLNDVEALALALPALPLPQLWLPYGPQLQPATRLPRAVIGCGTGLGVAGIVPHAGGWVAVPGEGGHATLAASDDFEAEVLRAARALQTHVSAERLLWGSGMPELHRAVAAVRGRRVQTLSAAAITARAAQHDEDAAAPVQTFCALLGGFAGDVALTFGAHGGLYVGGGVVPRLGESFARSRFRERFEAKGRFTERLRVIATPVIVGADAALLGAAVRLREAAAA